jgi:hypothetical protein
MPKLGRKELSASLLAMATLALPVSAHAVELSTSPVYADSGSSYHACNVANVSAVSVTLKVLMAAFNGVVIASSGAADITLDAGHSTELINHSAYTGFAICRFELDNNEVKNNVRANISVFHFTGVFYDTLALSEAR